GAAAAVGPVRFNVNVADRAEVLRDLDGRVLIYRRGQQVAGDADVRSLQDLDGVVVGGAATLVRIGVEVHLVVDVRTFQRRVRAGLHAVDAAVNVEAPPDEVVAPQPVDGRPGRHHRDLDVFDQDVGARVDADDARVLCVRRRGAAHDRPRHAHVAGGDGQEAVDVLAVDRRAVLGDRHVALDGRGNEAGGHAGVRGGRLLAAEARHSRATRSGGAGGAGVAPRARAARPARTP